MSTELFSDTLHAVSQALRVPVIIILLFLIVVSIVCLGEIIVDTFTVRRKLKRNMPMLLADMEGKKTEELYHVIKDSQILSRYKQELLQLLDNKERTDDTLCTMAQSSLNKEDILAKKSVEITDIVSKLGPMLGLMGTLIPLGPGIVALGSGDTATLSASLLVAFDTTVAGLVSAAVCSVISIVRKRWYRGYSGLLEAQMECVLEAIREESSEAKRQPTAQA
ncbi:MAG: MotA/TolQ/ExbB proton channel family protein [Oscillospiraceae bacterium]|nr:MotA/TolQ/ExbB proton channel family protein [Oscillospiraceae bacterium]